MKEWMKKSIRDPAVWISAAGLLVLTGLFLYWCFSGPGVSPWGYLAAFCSAALFAVLCLRFVPEWMRFWQRGEGIPAEKENFSEAERSEPRSMNLKLFFVFLAADLLLFLLVFLIRKWLGYHESFLESLEFWRYSDSVHYLNIAEDWYLSTGEWDRLVQLVFLPGYPVLVRLFHFLTGNYLYAGLLASGLSFSCAGPVIYRLLRLDLSHRDALRTVRYLLLLPGTFFFAAPMSESLFLLLTACCLYFARTGRWWLGCLAGGLASFTRSLGLILFVPLFFEAVHAAGSISPGERNRKKLAAKFFLLLLIPAGFGGYCLINFFVAGNPFQFLIYQREHWYQQLGFFFHTAAYQTDYAISCFPGDLPAMLGLWAANLVSCFGSLVLLLLAAKRLRPSYTAWFIAYFVVAIGATWLLSAPRYLLVLLPIPMALGTLTKKKWADIIFSIGCALLSLSYLLAFLLGWQVW